MNKFFLHVAFLALVLFAVPAQAQTAEEAAAAPAEAPAAAPETAPAPAVPAPPVVSAPSPVVSTEPLLTKALREGIALHVRQEQEFDANNNNRLEPHEIRMFLRSVAQDSSRGPVKNTSDLLYSHDRNKDGFIDRSEASSLPQ